MHYYSPQQLRAIAQRTGRWALKEMAAGPCLYTTNLGSYLRCQVNGSRHLTFTVANNHHPLGPGQVYAVRVDDQPWQRFLARSKAIKLALTPHQHTVELMAAGNTDMDAIWGGNQGFAIYRVGLDDAGTLTAAAPRPVIDFIGDSITAGCWVAGHHAAIDYRPESNYAAICADLLNADSLRIAYSAAGVLRPATGGVPVASKFLRQIDQVTPWVPNHPRLVVINLGVNDRRYPRVQFTIAYDRFIQQVVTTFPKCPIVLMVPFSQHFKNEITAIGHQYGLPVLNTNGWCPSYTDGLHPDQDGNRVAGSRLAKSLVPLLVKKV